MGGIPRLNVEHQGGKMYKTDLYRSVLSKRYYVKNELWKDKPRLMLLA